MLLVIIFQYFSDTTIIRSQQEFGLDFMMNLTAGTSASDNSVPFVMLDIDSQTYLDWGERVITPESKLISLTRLN